MKVQLRLDVFIDEDNKPDCTTEIWWNDCNWADVTFIQDTLISALRKMNDAGYLSAVAKGEITEDMVEGMKQVARR
jgi:hypothetical protein